MQATLDLAHVPPKKLEEAKKRSAVIAEYLKLERPTRALAQSHADRLGIKVRLFYILVKIYRERGTVMRSESVGLANRPLQLDPELDAVVAQSIETLGPTASLSEVYSDVTSRCEARNLAAPTLVVVRTRLARARRRSGGSAAFPELVVDRCPLALNIDTEDGPVAAWLTAVIHAPTARVFGHVVSVGHAGPREAMSALLQAAAADKARFDVSSVPPRRALVVEDAQDGWSTLDSFLKLLACEMAPPMKGVARGGGIMRLLGDRIGRIEFRPRLKPGRPARKAGGAVDFITACEAVGSAIRARTGAQGKEADPRIVRS